MTKIRIITIFTLLLIAVFMAGCSANPPQPQPPEPTQAEAAPQSVPPTAPAQPEEQADLEPTQPGAAAPAVELDGKALVSERCTQCHGLAKIEAKKSNTDGWKATVERMIGKGAQLSDAEKQAVIDYLAKTYSE